MDSPIAEYEVFQKARKQPQLNPRVNVREAAQLLKNFHSGLLEKHDHSLGVSHIRPSGHGNSLRSFIEHWEVARILRLMGLMKPRPQQDLPIEPGWWVWVLDYFQYRVESDDRPDLPIPSDDDQAIALVIFCNLLYRECIKDRFNGQKAQQAGKPPRSQPA